MQKKTLYGFISTLIIGVLILAGCKEYTIAEKAEHITEHVADELELDSTQRDQVYRSSINLLEKGQELKSVKTSMMDELIAQLRLDQVDEAQLNQVIAQNREKLDELIAVFVEEFSAFHQSLNPEQRAEAIEKIEKFRDRHSHWRHSRF